MQLLLQLCWYLAFLALGFVVHASARANAEWHSNLHRLAVKMHAVCRAAKA